MNQTNSNLDHLVSQIEGQLREACSQTNDVYKNQILESMAYSLTAGGKRLRPVFIHLVGTAFNAHHDDLKALEVAIEMIHTYSLIHDDLPAMDNDDLRRGKPTNHVQYGEATAILAGDGLLNLANEILWTQAQSSPCCDRFVQAAAYLMKQSGVHGMITGQIADMANENQSFDLETLDYINRHKTGALLKAAFVCGALVGDASEHEANSLEQAADDFGIAFQIADDLLDLLGTTESIGKPVGSDLKNDKRTYPMLLGVEKAQDRVKTLSHQAVSKLQSLNRPLDSMEKLILSLIERKF